MVTLETAESALKNVYLGVVANQLNVNANPLLSKIEQSTSDVWGKEIRKLAPFGLNGGVGAGLETSKLPKSGQNNYVQFVTTLKNLFGTIELSDKAIRASEHSAGAFVNLLNAEMEGLIKASSFNLGRMLYGDGVGILATVTAFTPGETKVTVNSTKNVMEGMIVDFFESDGARKISDYLGKRVSAVDRLNNFVYFEDGLGEEIMVGDTFSIQNSRKTEITGLGAIFGNGPTLYGVNKANNPWMNPYDKKEVGAISDIVIQEAIDYLDEVSGSEINFITCSSKVKRLYQKYLGDYRRNVDIMELKGGYKAISYNGIPLISDRFVQDDTMYLLNTKDFAIHQLCDWQWLEGDNGNVLKQNQGYPTYTATLVKYCDLICDKPSGQAKLSGIK